MLDRGAIAMHHGEQARLVLLADIKCSLSMIGQSATKASATGTSVSRTRASHPR
jgi:hypothetical protein